MKLKKTAPATAEPHVDEKSERARAGARRQQEAGEATPVKSSKNRGRTTGLPIMQYQDTTMMNQHKAKLTDEELGELWSTEFPDARCKFRERMDIVRTVRRLFNEKRHGNQQVFSDTPVPRYGIVGNKRVEIPEETRGKKSAEVEVEEEAPATPARRKAS